MIDKMVETRIFQEVSNVIESLKSQPFDEALPIFQDRVWEIGGRYGLKGDEVLTIYFNHKEE